MDMNVKGQLSFLILNCLLDRDFYGLDIISEVKSRSNGRINLKKPSVYSNLTRMEKQGQVSSYTRSSDVGPNRRYYSITEKGRNTYASLKEDFDRNHIDVFHDFCDTDALETPAPTFDEVKTYTTNANVQETTQNSFLENDIENLMEENMSQDDFFDFSSFSSEPAAPKITNVEETGASLEKDKIKEESLQNESSSSISKSNETSQAIFQETAQSPAQAAIEQPTIIVNAPKFDAVQQIQIQEIKAEDNTRVEESSESKPKVEASQPQSDATFLSKADMNDPAYNQRIYDITKDFNRYRKKRSFAEDQMAIEVGQVSLQEAETRKQERLENLKSALLENKGNIPNEGFARFQTKTTPREQNSQTFFSQEPAYPVKEEKKSSDAVFITVRKEPEQVFQTKKIEPPRLKINQDHSLPAPNRDTSIDPSHKEIISMLYSKSKGGDMTSETAPSVNSEYIYDYDDLSDYYASQNISFKTYRATTKRAKHNTNRLNLISSSITFILLSLMSGILFAILNSTGHTSVKTNFLYILLPALWLIHVGINALSMRHTSWEPKPMMPQWLVWSLTVLCTGIIFALNFIFGMDGRAMLDFATTLILPIALTVIILPIYYYIKRGVIVRFWR